MHVLSSFSLSCTNLESAQELLLVGEVMGSASSTVCTMQEVESLSAARVELERRRIDKQGRVKQKLSVVGLRCIDCAVRPPPSVV
jgi:hypothetical protein